jgi:hypothetical protein
MKLVFIIDTDFIAHGLTVGYIKQPALILTTREQPRSNVDTICMNVYKSYLS